MHDGCTVFVCVAQVMGHAAAAQSASLVFICIHRENYAFLETLASELKGKVVCPSQICLGNIL